jgi:rhamnulose-1-phosphate aldolase/alcohol dehydrogenase
MTSRDVELLIARSHKLASDRRNTNYGGGNTSVKTTEHDPLTGRDIELLYVKGSGGDLGTLKAEGLAVLRMDALELLRSAYRGPEFEDDMVALFDHCRFGRGGADPSIDTAMHAYVPYPHVDHLHPEPVIALATAVDGPELTKACYGDTVAWVPWRRPGFQLGLDIAALASSSPELVGVVLGGHGLTTWGRSSEECMQRSLQLIETAARFIERNGRPYPFGTRLEDFAPLPQADRRKRAAQLAPYIRGLCSTDQRVVGHFDDSDTVLEFLWSEKHRALSELGSSCPDHFLRTRVRPLVADLPGAADMELLKRRLAELHQEYREDYRAYYERNATPDSPPMRGADPTVVLVPGVGMFSFGRDALTARITGEFFVNTINAMRGAEAVSCYQPISESEKFRIEYWSLEEAKLRRLPPPGELQGRVAVVTGGGSGIGRACARKLARAGAAVVVADRDPGRAKEAAEELQGDLGLDACLGLQADVTDQSSISSLFQQVALRYGGVDVVVSSAGIASSASVEETTLAEWDRNFDVLAKGYFLVARECFMQMKIQGLGGSVVFVASKNALVAGKNASAYSAAKAAELHLARCLAEEGGEVGIRVNVVNPDAVLAGSSIWSSEWRAQRAATYGIEEDELEDYYRKRTTLKVNVYPEDVADAVLFFAGDHSSKTTGCFINVDGGVAAAYPR